jgi:ATP-dependent RNA helicase SUPV3L1/SUV3
MPPLPPESVVVLPCPPNGERRHLQRLGFRALGPQMLRVDLVERLARHAHEARSGNGERAVVDEALATSIGLQPQAVARLMRDLGFRAPQGDGDWVWRGPNRRRRGERKSDPTHAFAALAGLRRG